MQRNRLFLLLTLTGLLGICSCRTVPPTPAATQAKPDMLQLNKEGYFEKRGLNVMAFSDFYPEGHQGGVTVVLNGVRVAANGDVRLEPAGGQWQPIPKLDRRTVDPNQQIITTLLSFPDPARNRKGFNPIEYPDLAFSYKVHVRPDGDGFRITVDLNEPLPKEWVGKVGFNLELFPGEYFGTTYMMDDQTGVFPRQFNGPMTMDQDRYRPGRTPGRGPKVVRGTGQAGPAYGDRVWNPARWSCSTAGPGTTTAGSSFARPCPEASLPAHWSGRSHAAPCPTIATRP